MHSLPSRLVLLSASLLLGCNEVLGLSSLEKVDCAADCGGGGGSGGAGGSAGGPADVWLGRGHSCVTMKSGLLYCFGGNGNGQLGDGTTTPSPEPKQVVGLQDVTYVSLGLTHTCAVVQDGSVRCWGGNARGQLGDGTTTDHLAPTLVTGLFSTAIKVQAGEEHTCVEMIDGTVWCWGGNADGEIGDGTTTDRPLPVKVALPATIKKLSTGGGKHTCGALDDGTVWCWGLNDKSQLGNDQMPSSADPVKVEGLSGVKKVWAGRQHTCALLGDGTAQCWGANDYGQLGDGTTNQRPTPAPVPGVTSVGTLATGYRHTCAALTTAGAIKCWGSNDHGQMGLGDTQPLFLTDPTLVPGLSVANVAASSKGEHTCVLAMDGDVYCWGWNDNGQLGDGTTMDRASPTRVVF